MGRPRRKLGRTYNFYLSDEVDALIEQYRGNKSRSEFVEEAVKFYTSSLEGRPQEKKENQNITKENRNNTECRGPGLNRRPSDLQSDALPAELPRPNGCIDCGDLKFTPIPFYTSQIL